MRHLLALFLLLAATSAVLAADTWGTAQLPGDAATIGQVYKVGKATPLYFRLNSAAFTVSQVRIGTQTVITNADQKSLVLNFSIQNPLKDEVLVRWDSLHFTVVDAENVNHEGEWEWADAGTHARLEMMLKPAQRIEAYTVITVPANGPVPKLMVLPSDAGEAPILRYDLRGKVAKLDPPVADPADATGVTALGNVPAQLNTAYSLQFFDVTVEKTEWVTTALDGEAPNEGERFFVITLLCRNKSGDEVLLRSDSFKISLKDADGQGLDLQEMIGGTGNRRFEQNVKSSAEARVRIYFSLPQELKPGTLSLGEGEGRTYEFDVSK